jgi:hypothetical protein
LANSAYFLGLSLELLVELFGSTSVYNLKFKAKYVKSGSELEPTSTTTATTDKKKTSSYSSLLKLCRKQSLTSKNVAIVQLFYTSLFKSIALQNSNFVNKNSRGETERLVGHIYAFLCTSATATANSAWFFENILAHFIGGHFSTALPPTSTTVVVSPTKLANAAVLQSFYQFSFKYLLHLQDLDQNEKSQMLLATQIHTLQIYARNNAAEFLAFTSKSTDLLNAIVLIVSWCLTSETDDLRLASLDLFEHVYAGLASVKLENNTWWSGYVKKILRNRQEIAVDGSDYIRTRSLNKIFEKSGDCESMCKILGYFLGLSRSGQNQRFASMAYYLDTDLVLAKFKHALLDLFKRVRDEFKYVMLESVYSLLVMSLNDSASLLLDSAVTEAAVADRKLEIRIVKSLIDTLASNYLVTSKAPLFLNKNEKFFDLLVGYLNTDTAVAGNFMVGEFKQRFVHALHKLNRQTLFFQQLTHKLQTGLLRACFDLHVAGSLKQTSGGEDNEQIVLSMMLTFDLSSAHFVSLFTERARLVMKSKEGQQGGDAAAELATTKQMKKQMLSGGEKEDASGGGDRVDWRALKVILELMQSILIQNDSQMETDSAEYGPKDTFIDMIPYLFLGLF